MKKIRILFLTCCMVCLAVVIAAGQTSNDFGFSGNHILTIDVNVPNVADIRPTSQLPSAATTYRRIEYFDGLGRPLQSVWMQGAINRRDLIQPFQYDIFGRESVTYLPYVSTVANGSYRANALNASGDYTTSEQYAFYQRAPDWAQAASTKPFAVKVFERSPLDRVAEQGAPGEAWQPGSGATAKMYYEVNVANEVIHFQYETTTGNLTWQNGGQPSYYGAGQLYANRSVDEAGNEQITYTDKQQRVVMKKAQYAGSGNQKQFASTYYVYDNAGHLMYVLPPEAIKILLESIQ